MRNITNEQLQDAVLLKTTLYMDDSHYHKEVNLVTRLIGRTDNNSMEIDTNIEVWNGRCGEMEDEIEYRGKDINEAVQAYNNTHVWKPEQITG